MAEKNPFLLTPDTGEVEEIFRKGASSLLGLPEFPGTKTTTSAAPSAPAAQPAASPSRAAPTRDDVIRRANELGVDPNLALSFFRQESSGNWNSKDSPKGAVGGMQVMPGTYKMMMGTYEGQRDPWNNMEAGLRYIAYGQKVLGTKDPTLLAAGYHAGYDRKDLKQGIIPNTSDGMINTRDYAAQVAARAGLGGSQQSPASGQISAADLQSQLDQQEPGRYQVMDPDEAGRLSLQSTLDEQEPGRFQVLSPWEVDSMPDDAFGPDASGQKQEDAPPAAPTLMENLGDVARNLKIGANIAAQDFRELASKVLPKRAIDAIDSVDKWLTGKSSDELLKSDTKAQIEAMTPQMKAAMRKNWWDDEKGTFGNAWTDWRAYASGVLQSAPEMAVTMAPSMIIARAAYLARTAAGVPPAVAAKAAARAAALTGAVGEGALGGAQSSREVRDQIMELPQEVLNKSDAYRSLLSQGQTPEQALRTLAEDGASRAFVTAGVATGIFGGMGDRAIAKIVGEGVSGGVLKRMAAGAAKGFVGEGLFEELPQSAFQQIAQNEAMRRANPEQSLTEGVANQALGGLAIGAAQGGAIGAGAGALSRQQIAAAPAAAPAGTAAQAPQPSGPIGRAMEKATGAAPAEAADAPAAPAAEPVNLPRVRIIAENGDTMTGFAEQIGEDGSGRVIGDDGQVYVIGPNEGVTIEPIEDTAAPAETVEQAAPIEDAAEQDQAAPMADTLGEPEAMPQEEAPAAPVEQPAPRAEQPAQRPLTEWSEAELRDRLKYVAQQFKNASDRTVQRKLAQERREIEAEIGRRQKQAAQQPEAAQEKPSTQELNQDFPTQIKAQSVINRAGLSDTHHAVLDGAVWRVAPKEDSQNVRELERAGSDRTADGNGATDGRGTGTDRPVSGSGRTDAAVAGEQAAKPVPATAQSADAQPALKDPAAGKWFGSREKADAFVAKKKLGDTHEVVQTGRVRFEVKPKAQERTEQFAPETGTLGIPRAEMPQVPTESHGGLVKHLNAQGIEHETTTVPADELKPTQAEYSPEGVERAKEATGDRAVIVSNDGHIIDGHHQVLAAQEEGKDVKAIVLDAPVEQALEAVKNSPSAAATAETPQTLEFRGVQYRRDGDGWQFSPDGQKWAQVRSRPARDALDRGEDPNPADERIAPRTAPAPASAPNSLFQNNKIFTADKVEAARARLRSKLGQINSGIDPEVLIDGMTIAGAYIEGGVRKFSDFAAAMVADFGEKVKPYLLSFYEGARNYPGLDTEGMSTVDEAKAEHAALMTPEVKAEVAEAIGEPAAKPAKRTKKTGSAGDKTLTQDWGVDHIDGYGDEDRETGNTTKDAFLKEARDYLRAVEKILAEQGYSAPPDRRGRPRKGVSVNESGPATSGEVSLILHNPDLGRGIYAQISGTALRGVVPTTPSGVSIMFRATTEGDELGSRSTNRWAPVDLSAADLAIMLDAEVRKMAKPAKANTMQSKEVAQNDGQPTAGGADEGAPGQGAEGVSEDAGQRDAEAVPEQPAGRDAGSDRGSAPRVDRRAGERGEPAVPGGSAQAVAGTKQPAESGRGRGDSAGDRNDRGPVSRVGDNYRIQPGELTRTGSWRATAEQNVRIVELVKQLEKDGRRPTPEEAALLTKFTGWGASEIANGIFPDRYGRYKDASWEKLGERLKAALTPEEYAQARRTTQYAHYTSEGVIRSIYSALQRMGFGGGKVLEPGMGIGLFNGLMPDGMAANSQYTGVEYDGLTGAIAKLLYPESNIIVGDFTKTALPREFFDAAIGNPPFSSTVISNDPEYKRHGFMLHDYFFAKTIDRVKPGGLLVFVTSKGTMDKANDRARRYLAERANLLGAIRLPQTAFQANAGTEVVTDVIFLQKRGAGIEDNGIKWLGLEDVKTAKGEVTPVNEYFAAHPEMVLGTHALEGSMYRANEYTVLPEPGVNMDEAFARAVENLPEAVYQPGAQNPAASTAAALDRDFNPSHKKEGGLYVSDDGKLMQVDNGTGVELTHRRGSNGKEIALKPADKAFLKSWVGLRTALKQAQLDQLTDGDWQTSLKALGEAYDAFVAKHGNLLAYSTIERENEDGTTTVTKRFKNEPLLRLDVDGALAYSLEHIKESGEIVKAPVLTERVLQKRRDPEIKTTQDALFVSLNSKGTLDIDDVARLAGMSRQETIEALGTSIYEAPGQGWQTADAYLSGNVVRKLKEAEAAARTDPRYKRNVEALLAVQPKPLGPTEITVKLGQNWIPASDIRAFATEVLNENIDVSYSPRTGTWSAEQTGSNYSEFNTPRMNAGQILDAVLNNRQIKITFRDQDGKTHVDAEATEAANEVARKMRDAFSRWIWTDTKRSERLVNFYNENFNNIAPRQFDGSHLTLPGVSLRFNLYPHQKRAIWRMIQEGDTYLAHAVGAGKTFTMIAAGMEERRLGLSTKPMYVVPNHMLAQFAREFLELYPAANIMVADEENFHTHNRRRFVAQAALNNPDAIIITHSAFGRIGMSDEYAAQFIADQIDEWKQALDETDKGDRITRKQIERRIEQLERRLEARQGKEKKDQVLSFEELGVDRLFVDEAHEFRKLDFATNQGNIKGIDPSGSQRAMDMFMKVQYLRGKKPGRAIVMASGTPITNTMGELFTVQRFFQPEQMAEDGLDNFDAWANQYGDVVAGFEQNAAGGYEVVSRFAKFQNVPELMRRVRSFMDILTSSNLGELVQRPAVIGGGREVVVTPEPDGYRAYQKQLEGRINAIRARKGPPKKGDDIILNVIADGRFSSIDMRFVDPSAPSDPKSKLNQILDDLIAAYRETAGYEYTTNGKVDPIKGSSLILFTDIGLGEQSAKSRGFDMKAWIEQRLTDAGIPREHIAFMRDHKAHAKKERLFADMREGKKRILIGGKDMETGVNVQKRLTHLFHLDAPWFPASVEQREGRIIRQGNQNKEVVVRAYATKGSYDSTMWGMNGRKARFIEQAMNGDDSVRSLEDVSEASAFEMAAALASGDERYLRLAGLKADVDRLERLRFAHHDDQNKLRRDKHWAESAIERDTKLIDELKAAIAKRTPIRAGEFAGKVGKTSYDNREEFSNAIFNKFKDLAGKETDAEQQIGEIGGFPITFYGTRLKGSGEYIASVEVGVPGDPAALLNFPLDPNLAVAGIATRAANQVNALDRLLMEAEDAVSKNKRRVEQIGQRLGAPFPEEVELLDKMAELQALEAELTAEKAAEDAPAPSADAALATLEVEGEISNQDTPVAGQVGLAGDVPQSTRSEDLARRGDDAKYSVRDDGRMVAEFGPVYDEFKDDVAGAIKALMEAKEGEAVAAVTRDGVGEISLIYGDKDKGLVHIIERHGQGMLDLLPDLLRNGALYSKTGHKGRVYIGTPDAEATIRLDWDGKAKTWLVTAFERSPSNRAIYGRGLESVKARGAASTTSLGSLTEESSGPSLRRLGKVSRPTGNVNVIGAADLRNILGNGDLGGVISSLIEAGHVVLHDTASSLPVRNTPTGVQAMTTPDGKIHLVAENLAADTALPVLLHEAFHNGAEALIGTKAWNSLLGRLDALHRQAKQSGGRAREFYDAARQRVAAAQRQGAASADITAEEFGAYTIEEYAKAPTAFRKWVDDLIGAVKAWLLRRFGIQAGQVTPAQLRALAVAALREQAAQAAGGNRFSVADADTIEVDGVERPTRNSNVQVAAYGRGGEAFDWSNPGGRGLRGDFSRETKIGDTTIIYGVGSNGTAEIISVRTPQAKRGTGSARRALEAFLAEADQRGLQIKLQASPLDKKTSLAKLVQFYQSLGFELTGRKINAAGDPEMVRAARNREPAGGTFDADTITVDGKQRSTRNSAGQPIHHTEDGIRNFWRWFVGSKAIDEQGRPLVVYHGTDSVFTEFSRTGDIGYHFGTEIAARDRAARVGGAGVLVEPVTLSQVEKDSLAALNGEIGGTPAADLYALLLRKLDSPRQDLRAQIEAMPVEEIEQVKAEYLERPDSPRFAARVESAKAGEGFRVEVNGETVSTHRTAREANARAARLREQAAKPMALYLRIENPIRLPDLGVWPAQEIAKEAGFSKKEREQVAEAGTAEDQYAAVRAILEAKGFDGIVYRNEVEHAGEDSYIAFRPEQIKSAIGNRGTFDAGNPDIRYSVSPEEADKALDEATKALDAPPPVARDDYVGRVVQDVSLGARLLVHPRTIAAIHPEFTPVYNTGVSQMETRDRHIAEFGRDAAAYTALPQESKAKVNKILELGRLTSKTYTEQEIEAGVTNTGTKTSVVLDDQGRPRTVREPIKALLTETGEVVALNEEERRAYLDLRKMFDAALDKFRDQALAEFGFEDLVGQPNAAKEIANRIGAAKDAAETERLQNIARFIGEIEQAKRTGYVPFARYGDYVVTVKEKVADLKFVDDDLDNLIVHGMPAAFDTEMAALGATRAEGGWRIRKDQKRAVDRMTEKTVYSAKVETGLSDMLKGRKAANVGDLPSVKAAIEAARKEWVGDNPNRRIVAFRVSDKEPDGAVRLTDVDALAEIANIDNATWDAVRDKLATAIQGRSFRRHFFHSDNVPGYTGDFERAIADYVIGMAGYLSRREHQKRWDRAIDNIKDKGKLHQYATRYRDYVNSPQEEFALVRQLGFFSYIAGVLATAYANLTQVPMMTLPTLAQVAPAPLVTKEVARAYKDALAMMTRKSGLDMFDPNKAPEDVRGALLEAWDEGAFVPLETFDLMMMARQRNVGRRKVAKGFNDATKLVSVAFTFAERMNRLVTFIAAARLAAKPAVRKNAARVLSGDALARATVLGRNWNGKNFAEWAVDESQYRMGKANRPTVMRGVGASIMQFKSFMLQTIEAWYRMAALHGRSGQFAALASLGVLYALSGIWGLPGADDLRKLIEAAYKAMTDKDLDLKTELRAWVARVSGSNTLALMATKGVSYPLGVDLTRVGMGNIAPDSALSAAGIPFDMLIGRPARAFEKGSAGDYFGAAGELTPNFMKHWLVAGGWAIDGVRDKYGQRLVTGDALSKTDLALKAMGFQPSIVTDIRDYEYAQRRQETAADALKRRYVARIARTMVQMEEAANKGDLKRLDALDGDLMEIYAEIDKHNADAKPEAQIRVDRRALRNRMERERDGVMSTWGRERKAARGSAEELRGLFGLSQREGGEDEGDE